MFSIVSGTVKYLLERVTSLELELSTSKRTVEEQSTLIGQLEQDLLSVNAQFSKFRTEGDGAPNPMAVSSFERAAPGGVYPSGASANSGDMEFLSEQKLLAVAVQEKIEGDFLRYNQTTAKHRNFSVLDYFCDIQFENLWKLAQKFVKKMKCFLRIFEGSSFKKFRYLDHESRWYRINVLVLISTEWVLYVLSMTNCKKPQLRLVFRCLIVIYELYGRKKHLDHKNHIY